MFETFSNDWCANNKFKAYVYHMQPASEDSLNLGKLKLSKSGVNFDGTPAERPTPI